MNTVQKSPWKNAGGISWNATDSAWEDTSGKKYQINDDNKTFDDGTGANFNQDGTPYTGTKPNIFTNIWETVNSKNTISQIEQLAIDKIKNDTSLNDQQKQAQIIAITQSSTKNGWVVPALVVTGVVLTTLTIIVLKKVKK
jgi:hypothetical protein